MKHNLQVSFSNSCYSDTFTYLENTPSPPRNDFVLFYNLSDQPMQYYGDNEIDLSIFSEKEKGNKINFKKLPTHLREEGRWLWFCSFLYGKGVNKNTLSVSSLVRVYNYFIKPLALFADIRKLSITNILTNEKLLSEFVSMHQKETELKGAQCTLGLFEKCGKSKLGFEVAYSNVIRDFINTRINQFKCSYKQVAVIPPRIYKAKHNLLWDFITETEENILGLERIISYILKEKSSREEREISKGISGGGNTQKVREQRLNKWLNENNLVEYAAKYGWNNNRVNIQKHITSIQRICKEIIHFYSGMRDSEALTLNFHCLESLGQKRLKARFLGNTTKYAGNKKSVKWVTTIDMERVINILQTIAKPVAQFVGLSCEKNVKNICPLFISMSYLTSSTSTMKNHPNGKYADVANIRSHKGLLVDNEELIITEEDMLFLERLDPNRDWCSKGGNFKVGRHWHFTSHQYRRSLVVYAAQSGLVSMGSLQNQLQHILRAVTYYYSNGAENIDGLFKIGKNHVAKTYSDNKPLADFMAYVSDVLLSDELLLGTAGRFIEGKGFRSLEPGKQNILITETRKDTLKKFERGELAYKSTVLGGCGAVDACDSFLTKSFISCTSCDKAFIKRSKLKKTLNILNSNLNTLNMNSVEYRSEAKDFDELLRFAKKNGVDYKK
ncbi:hypothetical protein QL926_18475 [Pseudoalteromonas sp. APC 3213]|uniref:hypothetical protein n=1 Tax=Pseudoalteromonas sp. APC 3213 TaxID=3035178 RepID=UPI0025B52A13|nr:hypothetical protein [Pseudoalteromonas sp. APC 3213]MDN3403427.1 hypothetical protein [Pseudoalteromonas sp. APC 3213]